MKEPIRTEPADPGFKAEYDFCEYVARKKRDADLFANRLDWKVWLRPPVSKDVLDGDKEKRADVLSWLENAAYLIETALKAYLILRYGWNHPGIIFDKSMRQNGEGAVKDRTHDLKKILDYLETKNDRLVQDLCLVVDIETDENLRCAIERYSRLKYMVQYEGEGFPSDLGDDEFRGMMYSFRVFSLHLGNLIWWILREKYKCTSEKDPFLYRWLVWDRRAPKKDKLQGISFIDFDMKENGWGVNLCVDLDNIKMMWSEEEGEKELQFRFWMDWVCGKMPRKPELTVLFKDKDAVRAYDALTSLPPGSLVFNRCDPVGTGVIRCKSISLIGNGFETDLAEFGFNKVEEEGRYIPPRDAEGQWGEIVRLKGKDHYKEQFTKGMTDQHLAADRDFDHVMRDLIRGGAVIDALYGDDITPLKWAAHLNSYRVVPILLDAGAEIEKKGREGYTPLLDAAGSNNPRFDDPSVSRVLLDRGADVLAKTSFGLTVIHIASFGDFHLGSLQLFLDRFEELRLFGAESVDAQDKLGRTALHIACNAGAKKCIELLIDRGASQSIANNLGQLPLDVVRRPVDPDIWNMLDGR